MPCDIPGAFGGKASLCGQKNLNISLMSMIGDKTIM